MLAWAGSVEPATPGRGPRVAAPFSRGPPMIRGSRGEKSSKVGLQPKGDREGSHKARGNGLALGRIVRCSKPASFSALFSYYGRGREDLVHIRAEFSAESWGTIP